MPICQLRPSDVVHVQVDLRPVERALARRSRRTGSPWLLERLPQRRLGCVPLLVGAEAASPAGSRARRAASDAEERRRGTRTNSSIAIDLVCDLLRRCRRCGASSWVMWRTRRSPCSVPASSLRCSVDGLRVADRQLAVAAHPARRTGAVAGAVHRLERERPLAARGRRTCSRGSSRSGRRSSRPRRRRAAASSPRSSRASGSRAGGDPRARSRAPSPSGCQNGEPGELVGEVEEVELGARAGGGRASSPPRSARGARRDPPASRRRCRRSGSAAGCARRRASRRPRARAA